MKTLITLSLLAASIAQAAPVKAVRCEAFCYAYFTTPYPAKFLGRVKVTRSAADESRSQAWDRLNEACEYRREWNPWVHPAEHVYLKSMNSNRPATEETACQILNVDESEIEIEYYDGPWDLKG